MNEPLQEPLPIGTAQGRARGRAATRNFPLDGRNEGNRGARCRRDQGGIPQPREEIRPRHHLEFPQSQPTQGNAFIPRANEEVYRLRRKGDGNAPPRHAPNFRPNEGATRPSIERRVTAHQWGRPQWRMPPRPQRPRLPILIQPRRRFSCLSIIGAIESPTHPEGKDTDPQPHQPREKARGRSRHRCTRAHRRPLLAENHGVNMGIRMLPDPSSPSGATRRV